MNVVHQYCLQRTGASMGNAPTFREYIDLMKLLSAEAVLTAAMP